MIVREALDIYLRGLSNNNFLGDYCVDLSVFLMEKTKTEKSLENAAHGMADTVLAVIDKLAGKESDIKLSFEDLTLDMGMFKAKINGSIVLDIVYSKEAKS